MASAGGGSRRRRTLSDERIDALNLRDFLRVKEDDDSRSRGRRSLAGLTLSAVLADEKRTASSPPVNRTLQDIIRDDPNSGPKDSKKRWKFIRDKLRLRRAGAAFTSTVRVPASDIFLQNNSNSSRTLSRRNSTRFTDPTPSLNPPELPPSSSSNPFNAADRAAMLRRNSSRIPSLADRLDSRESLNSAFNSPVESVELDRPATEVSVETVVAEEAPVRMSLMALLAETDREMGIDGSAYIMDDDDDEEEEEEEEELSSEVVGQYNNCCVCMVRHKGAAFIPCGHTFCRLCSRELWVQRGNCPLCNGFILEILDIF